MNVTPRKNHVFCGDMETQEEHMHHDTGKTWRGIGPLSFIPLVGSWFGVAPPGTQTPGVEEPGSAHQGLQRNIQ
jgi:hypothetical protein